jgi:RNA polymerase sigma factor (TIGR02999 family)
MPRWLRGAVACRGRRRNSVGTDAATGPAATGRLPRASGAATLDAVSEDRRPGVDPAFVTRLLHEWRGGSQEALDQLMSLVYDELRAIASRQLRQEWRHDRLTTTVVVNEAYLKLFNQDVDWQNRAQFFAIAAQLMRRILIDHARHERRQKRGAGALPIELDDALVAPAQAVDAVDVLDLDRALRRLEALDPDQGRIVELRFFGGLTVEETAAALGVSPTTIKREWALAKGWLYRELSGPPPAGDEDG